MVEIKDTCVYLHFFCRVEDLLNKGWPEHHAEISMRQKVDIFHKRLPFKLKISANEKKLEPELLKKYMSIAESVLIIDT